jgi:hypothetical protein
MPTELNYCLSICIELTHICARVNAGCIKYAVCDAGCKSTTSEIKMRTVLTRMFSNYAQYDFLTAEMRAQHGGLGCYPATATVVRSALGPSHVILKTNMKIKII